MFVDEAKINVKGGDGGAGCTSFRREAHVPKGGPNGGNGGNGGNVVLVADSSVATLLDYHFKRHYKADRGTHGEGSLCHGATGDDMLLPVPLGTIVRDDESGETIADLTKDGQRVTVAEGGRGGRGNRRFVTSTRRAPTFSELGEPVDEFWITLEMKLLADAALVGFPNAGKSSLIAHMSAAKPKIADYPFTTLAPNLGVVNAGENSFVIADVPGLIEGASEGVGLGHEFLRHIERTALIVHVVDLTGGFEERDPLEDVRIIDAELEAHAAELVERPRVLAGNKADMPGTEEASAALAAHAKEHEIPYFEVSAVSGIGVDQMTQWIGQQVHELLIASASTHEKADEAEAHYIFRPSRDKEFNVVRIGSDSFEVHGAIAERKVIMTEMDNEEAVIHLQRRLQRMGVERALVEAGAVTGDDVTIAGSTFEFENPEDPMMPDEDEDTIAAEDAEEGDIEGAEEDSAEEGL